MPYPLPLTRTEAYLAYKAGVIQQSDLKPSLAVPRNGIDAWLAYWTGLAADYPKREDGTPHILQEEEAYIAYLCGIVNEYPEKCLRRVGAYLRYLISARWGRPDHPLNREELYLSLIKTQFIPSGDPSSDITIDGTTKAPFVDIKMYGDTFQQTYTGKNLLAFSNSSLNSSGVTSVWENGKVAMSGTATGRQVVITDYRNNNLSAGTYTFSMGGEEAPHRFIFRTFDANGQTIASYQLEQGATSVKVTISGTEAKYRIVMLGDVGYTYNETNYFQLEAGSTATSYEPFVGGQPSPSPSYPQQVQTVTGRQVVTVAGKNLFNYLDYTSAILRGGGAGATISNPNGNTLRVTNHIAQFNNFAGILIDNPSSLLGKNVTISANVDTLSGLNRTKIALFFGTETSVSTQIGADNTISSTGAHSLTCTVPSSFPSGANAIMVVIYGNGDGQGASFGGDGTYVEWSNVQLELGSTATAYEPYHTPTSYPISLGSIELCKLGTYHDYIYKDGDEWKVHKNIGKHEITGEEQTVWDVSTPRLYINTNALSNIGIYPIFPPDSSTLPIAAINKFVAKAFGAFYSSAESNGFAMSPNGKNFNFGDKAWTSGEEARASILGTVIYYALDANHTADTTITDTTLIAQLEALVAGGAENGTTYIKVNATDPNLPGLLYVEAPKYE